MIASCKNPTVRGAVAVTLVVAAGSVWSIYQTHGMLQMVHPETPLLFDHGLTSLNSQASPGWTNEQCGTCHQSEFQQWSHSKHAEAGSNSNFQAQFLEAVAGRAQWCLNCHAPFNHGALNHASMEPEDVDELFVSKPDWLVAGVDCLSCHVRDGQVLGTRVTDLGLAAHPMRRAPELGTPEFCGGCHQFAHKPRQFPDAFRGRLQQASLEELIAQNRVADEEMRCHDCHLAAGNHKMPGGYDRELVTDALSLSLNATWRSDLSAIQLVVSVSVHGVGHRVPGGEHFFRFLSVRTTLHDASGEIIIPANQDIPEGLETPITTLVLEELPRVEEIRKRLGDFERGKEADAAPTPDTRLNPNETRTFEYLIPLRTIDRNKLLEAQTSLWYHVLDPEEAKGFRLPVEELSWELHRVSKEVAAGGAGSQSIDKER